MLDRSLRHGLVSFLGSSVPRSRADAGHNPELLRLQWRRVQQHTLTAVCVPENTERMLRRGRFIERRGSCTRPSSPAYFLMMGDGRGRCQRNGRYYAAASSKTRMPSRIQALALSWKMSRRRSVTFSADGRSAEVPKVARAQTNSGKKMKATVVLRNVKARTDT